jgi:diadenosine tetraphosphate (Ap4A) HIT family hydrolase
MPDSDPSFVRDEGGRGVEDMAAMKVARKAGTCPFCQIIASEKPDQSVLYETNHWAVFANIRPEDGTELHLTVAAKLDPGHDPKLTFDDLGFGALSEFGSLIRDLAAQFGIKKGRSVFMRIDSTGNDTATTVFHPCFHVVVSDSKPVKLEDINPALLRLFERRRNDITMAFREAEPELAKKAVRKGDDELWSEALKYLMSNAGLLRSSLTGKAIEIRPKLSNKATQPEE